MRVSSAHSLARSRSLVRVIHAQKNIFKIIAFSVLATNTANAQQPNYGQVAIDGMVQGILKPFTHGTEGATSVGKSFEKQIFKPEGSGKIETKDGRIKIDTKDAESMRIAAEFRQNYGVGA